MTPPAIFIRLAFRAAAAALALVFTAAAARAADEPPKPLVLEMVKGSVARNERSVKVTIRLRNVTDHSVSVYLRRDLITYDVVGPDGRKTICMPMDNLRHPARLGFTRIRAHRSVVLTTRLMELCPQWTFAKHGEYAVQAHYAPQPSGRPFGLHAFTGELDAKTSVPVTVKHNVHVVANHFVPTGKARPARPAPARPPPRPRPRPRPRLPARH